MQLKQKLIPNVTSYQSIVFQRPLTLLFKVIHLVIYTPNPNVINGHAHSSPNEIHMKSQGKCKKRVHTF